MADRDEEIIARLRRSYDAFNRGDFDAAAEMAHPEIEFVRPGGQPSLRGADALRRWMEPEAIEEQVIEPLEFSITGNKVLVRAHARGRGAGSGIEVDVDFWAVWTLNDDGLATRLEWYLDHEVAEAREAAGLRE
jgi:ketosteroid isomerase-like protein